jgi:transcription elongation GreA/GreB family factor
LTRPSRENYAWRDVKTEQGLLELRIARLRSLLKTVQPLDDDARGEQVRIGSWVTLLDLEDDCLLTRRLVSPAEHAVHPDGLSTASPVGRAILALCHFVAHA